MRRQSGANVVAHYSNRQSIDFMLWTSSTFFVNLIILSTSSTHKNTFLYTSTQNLLRNFTLLHIPNKKILKIFFVKNFFIL